MKQALFIAAALAVIGSAGLYAYKTSLEWKVEAFAAKVADCRQNERAAEQYTADAAPAAHKFFGDLAAECRRDLNL